MATDETDSMLGAVLDVGVTATRKISYLRYLRRASLKPSAGK
jgi:hypothetical protein